LLAAAVAALISTGCDQKLFRDDLEAIQARGCLRVITRNNGTCYYEGPHRPEGFEHDLVKAFADHLGVTLELIIIDSEPDMVAELLHGEADLIAANFLVKEDLRRYLSYGPVYGKIEQLLVGRRGGPRPGSIEGLAGLPIWIMAGAFHEKQLRQLNKQHRNLTWMALSDYESEELLEMVETGAIPLTLADSNIIALNRRYYPELEVLFAVAEDQSLAWVIHPRNLQLRAAVDRWFADPATVELLERLNQHYYGHLDDFNYLDITTFQQRMKTRLPRYQPFFEASAADIGIDWKLLAALSYQESHWNPRARSFTGVRGLMMLTRKTAKEMGVSNRLDPEQSVTGGTRYLNDLHRRIGSEVPEPDRTFMALAAYNVGWGHLQDARTLARRLGKNKNAWPDVRSVLPLLRLKKFYRKLPHGYARGAEPVQYVDRIRTYHRILLRQYEKTGFRPPGRKKPLLENRS
jgi:membrane-bound lytic murein transglycosylase F